MATLEPSDLARLLKSLEDMAKANEELRQQAAQNGGNNIQILSKLLESFRGDLKYTFGYNGMHFNQNFTVFNKITLTYLELFGLN